MTSTRRWGNEFSQLDYLNGDISVGSIFTAIRERLTESLNQRKNSFQTSR
jgi:hypothetical protein